MTSAPSHTSLLITTVLVLLLFPPFTHAQRKGYEIPDLAKGTLFGISTEAPILAHLLQKPGFNGSVHTLTSFVSNFEKHVLASLPNQTIIPLARSLRACNVKKYQFAYSTKDIFSKRGLPYILSDCFTDIRSTSMYSNREVLYQSDSVFEAVLTTKNLQEDARPFFVDKILSKWKSRKHVLVNWETPYVSPFLSWNRDGKRCELYSTSFVRVGNFWYADVSISNAQSGKALGKWARQSIQEFVHVGKSGSDAHALPQRVPKYLSNKKDGPPMDNATTTFSRSSGPGPLLSFYPMYPYENKALIEVIQKADQPAEQTKEALAPTSMCLLFLPLVLNLVPAALTTKVTSRGIVVYMLFSDIVTVVPLAIEGIERISTGSHHFRSILLRVENDRSGNRTEAAAGKIWAAQCLTNAKVREHGIAFLVISIVAAVVGVGLEIWAIRFMARTVGRREELYETYVRVAKDEEYGMYILTELKLKHVRLAEKHT